MRVYAVRPYFAPYPGFFALAKQAGTLLLLDGVQFPRGTTWLSRNRLKNAQGTLWLTVPCAKKGLGLQAIDAVRINDDARWRRKSLKSLESAYVDAPFFADHLPLLQDAFSGRLERLVDLNLLVIEYLLETFDVAARLIRLSELGVEGQGAALIVAACRALGADGLVVHGGSGAGLDRPALEAAGIEVEAAWPKTPVYPQLWGEFLPNLSALDLLFCCGPRAGRYIEG